MSEKSVQESPLFIAVLSDGKGGNSPKQVKEEYDYYIGTELYSRYDINGQPLAYELLEKYIGKYSSNRKIVVISEDTKLPYSTVNAYSKINDVATVYISNNPYIIDTKYNDRLLYFGIDKDLMADQAISSMEGDFTTYFTLQKVNRAGIQKICKVVRDVYNDKRIHLIIDLQIVDQTVAPSVKRQQSQKNYLSMENISEIVQQFNNINYLDIIGFDESLDDPAFRYSKITGEVCRAIIKSAFNIKERSLNIFTEDSRFLIYRPIKQITNYDIGWYIVRFMTIKERETFLKHLIDRIETISIDVDQEENLDVMVTSTSVSEQNQKSFYTAKNIFDYCLFPEEKLAMIFELLNTEKQSIAVAEDKKSVVVTEDKKSVVVA
jgi:hypothetical protein